MRDVFVLGLGLDDLTDGPVLLLQETRGSQRVLPIRIGAPEAEALERADRRVPPPHPCVHGLIAQVVTHLGRRLDRVSITVLSRNVLHAELLFDGGISISARPGDAVVLAIHLDAPITVADLLLDQLAVDADSVVDATEPPTAPDPLADTLDQFRAFLATARPEDFDRS